MLLQQFAPMVGRARLCIVRDVVFEVQIFRLLWDIGYLVHVDDRLGLLAFGALGLRPFLLLLSFRRLPRLECAVDLFKSQRLDNYDMLHTLLRRILHVMHLLEQVASTLIRLVRLLLLVLARGETSAGADDWILVTERLLQGLHGVVVLARGRLADEVGVL